LIISFRLCRVQDRIARQMHHPDALPFRKQPNWLRQTPALTGPKTRSGDRGVRRF
jgi:hypothetical protein